MADAPHTALSTSSPPNSPLSSFKMNGSRFEQAAAESTVLRSESAASVRSGQYVRVLDCFVLALNGKAVSLDESRIASQDWNGLTAVGAVASLVGPGSLFAQCGWLHRVSWLWLVLPKVEQIVIKADSRFWGGGPRIWLKTPLGEYAVLSPHKRFTRQWSDSIVGFGPRASACVFRRWPADGPRPSWWPEDSDEQWPASSEATGSTKRPASPPETQLESLSLSVPAKRARRMSDPGTQAKAQDSQSREQDRPKTRGLGTRQVTAKVALMPWDPRAAVASGPGKNAERCG
ncbi:hypothetical protein FRC08_013006 [Ceratobasidium sp. 394]|nr:hypothetical protein FRC08_013006 [Ceratobasidium sp. 394]KAG9095040.1 hypothetical protein FS749_011228 [Ceratobasidium sp. UAMH 11750]